MRRVFFLSLLFSAAVLGGCGKGGGDVDENGDGGGQTIYRNVVVLGSLNGHVIVRVEGKLETRAIEGQEVVMTPVADDGYQLSRWTVESQNLEIENPRADPLNLTMPKGDVRIRVAFEVKPANVLSEIPNAVFRAYCRRFDADEDGVLTPTEAGRVTRIDLDVASDGNLSGITSLAGIERFTGLRVLSSNVPLTALDLSRNAALTTVTITGSHLTALDASSMLDTYKLFCGRQTSDGSTPQTLTLTLRNAQISHWRSKPEAYLENGGVVLAS